MTATTGLDVVEVLRGTSAGPWLVAAGAVGGVAAVATVVAAVVWWTDTWRPGPRWPGPRWPGPRWPGPGWPGNSDQARPAATDGVLVVAGLALAASLLEAGLLLVDGAEPAGRWLLAVLARVLLLLALLFLRRTEAAPPLPGALRGVLALLLLVTAGLGAPTTASAGQLAWPAALVVATAVLVRLVLTVAERRAGAPLALLTVLMTAALAVPAAVWTAPDPVPPHHQERVVVDGLTLDLTLAPVRPGTNEAHLYAFDRDGRPTPVTDVHLAVDEVDGSTHRMFEVSPDHHLSYVLELPPSPPWTVAFTLVGDDGRHREATLHLTGD